MRSWSPTLVLAVIDAFLFTRYSTTLSCPSLAAQWRGVSPSYGRTNKQIKSTQLKAETHDAINRCDTSRRQVASTALLLQQGCLPLFCRCDMSQVWIRATDRSHKIMSQQQWFSHVTRGDLLQQRVAARGSRIGQFSGACVHNSLTCKNFLTSKIGPG